MAGFIERHPDGFALGLAVVAGFLFCLGIVVMGMML